MLVVYHVFILVFVDFDVENKTLGLIAPVPGHCLLLFCGVYWVNP